ncbi:MAG TPA: protein-L-isoaspartate(D-aspartate) O-methyltransferase [Polyangia bacterium]|nr:protein-L-isoaspartate(D-aspartate) O-methyltransferase [Polyangia bacterium]
MDDSRSRGGSGSGGGAASDNAEDTFLSLRRDMVLEQLARRDIRDPRVLEAMGAVPRHRFVDPALATHAYADRPLAIGYGQTISQPYMVARATELAAPRPTDRALEVGAGSGYQTAVLAELVAEVFAIEIVPQLAERARQALAETGYRNVTVESFDGSGGWPDHAPYDVIIVSAGAPRIPALLVSELAEGGRLVIPVGGPEEQELAVVRRQGDHYVTSYDTRCRYVDLQGRFGVGGGQPAA